VTEECTGRAFRSEGDLQMTYEETDGLVSRENVLSVCLGFPIMKATHYETVRDASYREAIVDGVLLVMNCG
jgi:hypothetical protein